MSDSDDGFTFEEVTVEKKAEEKPAPEKEEKKEAPEPTGGAFGSGGKSAFGGTKPTGGESKPAGSGGAFGAFGKKPGRVAADEKREAKKEPEVVKEEVKTETKQRVAVDASAARSADSQLKSRISEVDAAKKAVAEA